MTSAKSPPNKLKIKRLIVAAGGFIALCFSLGQAIMMYHKPNHHHEEEARIPHNKQVIFNYKAIGLSPMAQPKEEQDSPTSQYAIELDVVYSQRKAEALLSKYKKKGIDVYFSPFHKNGQVLFRVRHGITDSLEKAQSLAKKLKENHSITGKITQL